MTIRHARPEDLDALTALEAVCFPPAEAADRETIGRRLAAWPEHFWLLEENGRVISMINGLATDEPHLTDAMYEDASLHREHGAWQMIFGVDTVPARRGQGCAGRLMRRVIADARDQGRRGLVLTCKDHLVGWYAGFGFADEGISGSQHGGVVWHEMRLTFPEND